MSPFSQIKRAAGGLAAGRGARTRCAAGASSGAEQGSGRWAPGAAEASKHAATVACLQVQCNTSSTAIAHSAQPCAADADARAPPRRRCQGQRRWRGRVRRHTRAPRPPRGGVCSGGGGWAAAAGSPAVGGARLCPGAGARGPAGCPTSPAVTPAAPTCLLCGTPNLEQQPTRAPGSRRKPRKRPSGRSCARCPNPRAPLAPRSPQAPRAAAGPGRHRDWLPGHRGRGVCRDRRAAGGGAAARWRPGGRRAHRGGLAGRGRGGPGAARGARRLLPRQSASRARPEARPPFSAPRQVAHTDNEWREILSPQAYTVLRQVGFASQNSPTPDRRPSLGRASRPLQAAAPAHPRRAPRPRPRRAPCRRPAPSAAGPARSTARSGPARSAAPAAARRCSRPPPSTRAAQGGPASTRQSTVGFFGGGGRGGGGRGKRG